VRLTLPTHRPLRVFHLGGYWRGPNDMVMQMMLGLRAAGAEVVEYSTDEHREALDTEGRLYDRGTTGPVWLRWEQLQGPLEGFAPDLVICNAGGLSFRPEVAAALRSRLCLLGVALSDPDVFVPATRHIAPLFDVFLTNAPVCIPDYQALGAAALALPIATNDAFFRPVPPRPELACEVLVLGRVHPDRVEPVRALIDTFDTHLYGEKWEQHGLTSRGLIYGEDALAALASAKATVLFFKTGAGHALVKVGIFDFAAAGALVVTNEFDEVRTSLTYGREIVGFTSTADLLAKIRYYLDHPDEAEAVRRAGRARVLAEHTWPTVWPRLLRQLAESDGAGRA
jgi:spore maturation protein CgeB